ncbi:protein bicaudal C homolog 1 [Elysia marginata]|uniref:Protein bicaudal C homolog 1 n=1 Tax=Elysia marginata TaxID=1093978 RepID=A0AAV4EEZ7_9GAST|nr:protein bicaudal C homolog 1 [Elysia marginata]
MFELPVTSPLTPVPDVTSPLIQQLQQTHGVTVTVKQRARSYGTSVQVRGSVHSAKEVKQATGCLMEQLTGNSALPVSTQLEIAPQHHLFIIGRGAGNVHQIMQQTGAHILFPDPATTTPQRRGTVFISGGIESVFLARQYLMGCLPLVLMFDVKEAIELDQGRITQLMETLDVFISVKPKPKQPSKSVIVKSIERNARNMYLVREILVGLRSEANIAALLNNNNTCSVVNRGSSNNGSPGGIALSLAGLSLLSPRLVSVSTNSFLLNGHHTGQAATSSIISSSNNSTQPAQVVSVGGGQALNTSHWLTHTPGVYSPLMVVTPATSSLNSLAPVELLSPPHGPASHAGLTPALGTNGFHHDYSSSAFIRVPTPLEPTGHSSTTSESTSPPHSPSSSPSPVGLCSTAADLANLQKAGTLSEALSHEAKANLLAAALRQQQQQQIGSAITTSTTNNSHQHHLLSSQQQLQHHRILQHHHTPAAAAAVLAHQQQLQQQQQQQLSLHQHHHHHHHVQHPLEVLGLSKTASLTQLSSMAHCPPSPAPLFNGMAHTHGRLLNGDGVGDPTLSGVGPSEKLAPGMERKNSTTSLFASPLQFAFDYEQKKLLAMKAMQKKPEGESRIPTDIWAGMGFSKSMPESAIRDKLGQMGISARVTDTSLESGYEPNRPEIDLSIDQDLWAEDGRPERTVARPLNKAPGEYPSPRKKAMQKKPEGESRIPTDIWAGMGFSKSMPESAIRDKLGQMGISARVTDTSLESGYEPNRPEIDLSIDQDLWAEDGRPERTVARPLNKAPGEYPSPRKKDHDLRELGISTFGARRKMLLAIADLNKRRTLTPMTSSIPRPGSPSSSVVVGGRPSSPTDGGAIRVTSTTLTAGGNSASELFPSPDPPPSLMSARGGPDLASLSGHW